MKKQRGQQMADIVALTKTATKKGPRSYDMREIIRESESDPKHVSENILEDELENGNEDEDMFPDKTSAGELSSKKRGRGPSIPWEKWGEEKKIIEWNESCEPIGKNASRLMSQLGTFARNGIWFPLTVTSWDGVDKNRIEEIWKSVKAFTNAPDGFKKNMNKKLNVSWKHLKNRIKKKYFDDKTDEERLAVVPKGVQPDQWPVLVAYWNLPAVQEIAKINAENRKSQYAYPRIGRNSIPNIVHEKREQPVDLLSLWEITRIKNGKFDEKDGAAGIQETIMQHLEALPEEERQDLEKREEIFNAVLVQGRQGVTLCEGVLARKRSRTSRNNSNEAELAELIAREEEARARLEECERQKEKQEAEMNQMKNDLKRTQEIQAK